MSSSVATSSSFQTTRKVSKSKNPGLALNLTGEPSSSTGFVIRGHPATAHSFSDTPRLEPDWDSDDASDSDEDAEVQYIYIPASSPFYKGPTSPRSSAYLSVSGFPFACDALAQEDPLFVKSPALFDEDFEDELSSLVDDVRIVGVDEASSEEISSQSNLGWNPLKLDSPIPLNQDKPAPVAFESANVALQSF
ncbi:hypothetical protein Hypma_007433 [Hypsizygus marmoreus]|uniref:Uncharacterized protein n=1 Tax=Hypsizygus marmoreus TaxID=39966 RepID=A0A369K1R8_HYPMA|nr:hypothetical protein Hypma_007433 [Hypsizygus marmoreus]